LRVLVLTRIFPNPAQPILGLYNRLQLGALGRLCEVEVLAALPWFPGAGLFGDRTVASQLRDVPRHEVVAGLRVSHPRCVYIPKLHLVAGGLYAASLLPEVLRRRGRFDVILGAWAFPDGCGAVALGELLRVPAVIKVHGSDINVFSDMPGPRRNLRWALPRARRVVTVSRQLADKVIELGAAPDRVDVVLNGIDTERFKPRDRAEARAELGHGGDSRRWLVYVGRLSQPKGVDVLLQAFESIAERRDDLALVLIGDGELTARAREVEARLPGKIIVAGPRPHDEVASWLAASDVLVLPSLAEGTPNVILEAMACGRRVVATQVGGIPDVVNRPLLGELVPAKDAPALAAALARASVAPYDPEEVARVGARGGWADSARNLHATLQAAVAR
jgi:glycosyltransferase involved in cell wall biosynthesis